MSASARNARTQTGAGMLATLLLCIAPALAEPRTADGYLPMQLAPGLARQLDELMLLADRPVLRRPIALSAVRQALPAACGRDPLLCEQVTAALAPYLRPAGVTALRVDAALAGGADYPLANLYGLDIDSPWQLSASAHMQLHERVRLTLGGVAWRGEFAPTGTVLGLAALGTQLDIGYRERWLSPMSDSSMLISTQATTMPSVTLSNQAPYTRFRLGYELFAARMSSSDRIVFGDGFTSGYPRLAGLHVAAEPLSGWALGANRVLQFGGGERGGDSVLDGLKAFFRPSRYSNVGPNLTRDEAFGNQAASLTTRVIFPGSTPFSVYFEYAGEDTSRGRDYLLGNSALSAGIHFPRLRGRYDLRYEISEWQNAWYTHGTYRDGLVNRGRVLGHWGADQRVFGDPVGAQSHMLRLSWGPSAGGDLELRYRTLANQAYTAPRYRRAHEAGLRYIRPWQHWLLGGEVLGGRDVFGDGFVRVGVFANLAAGEDVAGGFAGNPPGRDEPDATEIFVLGGINTHRVRIDLADSIPRRTTSPAASPHIAIGARRAAGDRLDVGARLEFDDIDGRLLISARAVDLRYRTDGPLAFGVFAGAARYDLATPAYGLYGGAGASWRDIASGWDLGLEIRYAMKVARDRLLASDPDDERPDAFYDIASATLSLSRRF